MRVQPQSLRLDQHPIDHRDTDDQGLVLLNSLRFANMGCRVKPRTDLFKACALLHVTQSKSVESHADALMRCLSEAIGKPIRMHSPGTDELSFDEAWLLQLARAYLRADTDSIAFLLRSRVQPEHRRLIGFLMTQIVRHFRVT